MAQVSGLTSLQSNNAPRHRKEGRQGRTRQVNRQVSLRPNATPGQYYIRPAHGQAGTQARQVAEALSSIAPTLGKLSTYMAEKQRKEAEQQAQVELQKRTIDEARQLVDQGSLEEYENPYFQEAFQRQYGVRLGLHEGRKLVDKFNNTYDPREGGVEEFIAQNMEVDLEGVQQNPLVEGGFSDAMEETIERLKNEAAKRTAEAYHKDKLDGVYETFDAEIRQRIENADSPEARKAAIDEAYQAIRSHYPDHKELLNLSNSDQDAVLMQVAARYAREGDVDVVEKLLTDPRGKVGAIIDKRGREGAEASKILSEAISNFESDNRSRTFDQRMDYFYQAQQGIMDEEGLIEWHKQNPGAYTDEKVESLIRNNRAAQEAQRRALRAQQDTAALRQLQHRERMDMIDAGMEALLNGTSHHMPNMLITNDKGEPEVMEGEDIIKEAQTYMMNEWVHQQVQGEEDPGEAAFNLLTEIYSKNPNLENEQWKNTLINASGALDAAGALDGESIPPKLREGYELYRRLSERNPGLRDSMITQKDKDVYEAIRISQDYMHLDFDRAVRQAYKHQANQDIADNPSIQARYQEVDRAVANLNGYFDGWGSVKNDSYASTELRKIGRYIALNGGPTDLAEATKRFKEEHEYINGWAVPTKGLNVPGNFKEMAEKKIQEYVEENPDEGIDAGDISVFPISGAGSTGVWTLVDNTTGSPLMNRVGSQFTLSELQRDQERWTRENAEEEVEKAHTREARNEEAEKPSRNVLQDSFRSNLDRAQDETTGAPPVSQVPDSVPEDVRNAIQLFRDHGITKSDYDHLLRRSRSGSAWATGSGLGAIDTSFAVNPAIRETIRKYLPD